MGVAYIATTVNGREYVVLIDNKVVAGPFATAAEAVRARDAFGNPNQEAPLSPSKHVDSAH